MVNYIEITSFLILDSKDLFSLDVK